MSLAITSFHFLVSRYVGYLISIGTFAKSKLCRSTFFIPTDTKATTIVKLVSPDMT